VTISDFLCIFTIVLIVAYVNLILKKMMMMMMMMALANHLINGSGLDNKTMAALDAVSQT